MPYSAKSIVQYYNSQKYEQLADQAYDILVELFITLNLIPGKLYSETDLIFMTGIGRTPIRDAEKKLEFYSVLSVLPRSGIQISDMPSREEIQLAREVRNNIEEIVIRRTALNAYPHERKNLLALTERYERGLMDNNVLEIIRSDLRFHEAVAHYARNPFANNALMPFIISECRLFFLECDAARSGMEDKNYTLINNEHLKMMHCVIDGDADGACNYLRNGLRFAT